MTPRVIGRTHYQVDEPAYLRALIENCSSPIKSDYTENLAGRLKARINAFGKDFNLPAAKYAVDLAHAIGILTNNNFWTDLGHLVPLCAEVDANEFQTDLSDKERILFFRLFLEFDGAALIFFARLLNATGAIPTDQLDWNRIANDMMKYVYTEYLDVSTSLQERSQLRQTLQRRLTKGYSGKSGPHQTFIHLQALARMRILDTNSVGAARQYRIGDSGNQSRRLQRFLAHVPNVRSLEDVITNRQWPSVAYDVFDEFHRSVTPSAGDVTVSAVTKELRRIYERVMTTGVALCPLRTLFEAIQIDQIVSGYTPWSYDRLLELLKEIQNNQPQSLVFHVDRLGRPAFVRFSASFH